MPTLIKVRSFILLAIGSIQRMERSIIVHALHSFPVGANASFQLEDAKVPHRIKRGSERIVISKLAVALIRNLSPELSSDARGASADDVLLVLAAFIGQAESKPMTPAKLALYVGLARPTAIRRLQRLARQRIVEFTKSGAVVCPYEMLNVDGMMAAVDRAASAIHSASRALSRMDSKTVAKH